MIKVRENLKNIRRTAHDTGILDRSDFLRLDMNENPDGLPKDFIQTVLSQVTPEYLSMYPDQRKASKVIAQFYNLFPENILLCNGSDGGIKLVFETYLERGNNIVLTDPTFAMYHIYSQIYEINPIVIPYKDILQFPYESFFEAITPEVKMVVLVNPNNPTGTVIEEDKLLKLIEKAKSLNVLFLVDEAYFYYYDRTVIQKIKEYKNLIVIRTFSKLCGIAGLRIGYLVAVPEIIYHIKKIALTYDVNALGVLFAEKLFQRNDIIEGMIKQAETGKNYLLQALDEKQISYIAGYGNFILISCTQDPKLIQKKLKDKNILVSIAFQKYIRVSIASKEKMEQFLQAYLCILSEE